MEPETSYELLGSAEREIVSQLRGLVESNRKQLQRVLDILNEINTDNLEELMLDEKKRETLISLIGPLSNMQKTLSDMELGTLIISVVLK
jgi:hypothetical protein